jgi:tape measure domain-containing protein
MADLRARIIISSSDQTRPGFDSARQGLDNLRRQAEQVRNVLLGALGISLGGGLIKQLIQTADEYKNLNAAIKLSTESDNEFARAQEAVYDISQRTSTSLRSNADLFRRVSASVRDMGSDQERAFNIIELIGKSVALSGVSAETSAAGIQQFNQGLGSGVLRGEEFNSVMENTPRLAQALADGLQSTKGELRAMAEQGKLTTEVVLNALESQAAVLNNEFAQVPKTVGAALVRVQNAWTVFLGQFNQGVGATDSLADGFNLLADNMREVVDTGLTVVKVIGLIYAAKILQGIQSFVAAQYRAIVAHRQAAEAAAHEALAQQEALRVQMQATAVRAKAALAMLEEARLQRALAVTDAERAAAQQALNRAVAQASLRSKEAAAASLAYRNSLEATAVSATRAERAMTAMNNAFFLFIAYEIGKTIGEWLTQFEKLRQAGSYVAEAFVLVTSGVQAMFDGLSMQERFAQIQQIHAEFNAIRAADTDAARNAAAQNAAAEEQKAQAAEAAAERQKQAWKQVDEGMKALTASIDADASAQNAILQQRLNERLAAIDASNAGELQKDAERTQVMIASAQAELELASTTANAKLQLIYQSYGAQIQSIGTYNETAKQLDRNSIEARKGIYTELATHYQQVVDQLTQAHLREVQAAQNAGQQIRDLAQQHQFDLADIERQGVSTRDKIKSEESEFDKLLAEVAKERAKGKAADQEKINAALQRASQLNQDISQSTISLAQTDREKSDARSDNAERLNKLYAAQKAILEDNKKAHEDNAKSLAAKQQEALGKLAEVNQKVGQITEILNKQYALQISADTSAIDAAIAKINSIPTEKVVTIRTVNVGGAAVQAQTGGLIQRFANGGYPRRQGQLPGYGGGDKVPALLEAGEFIVRKEAVAKLGKWVLQAVNQGVLPLQRATGGPVEDWKKQLLMNLVDPKALATIGSIHGGLGTSSDALTAPRTAIKAISKALREHGLTAWQKQINEVVENFYVYRLGRSGAAGNKAFELQSQRYEAARERLMQSLNASGAAKTTIKAPKLPTFKIPEIPKLSIPSPSLNSLPAATLLQAAQSSAAPGKTINVQFTTVGGEPVVGQFAENDLDRLFKTLREAGMRSTGGHF